MELRELISELFPGDEREMALELTEDYDECEAEDFYDKHLELVGDYEDAEALEEEVSEGVICLGTLLVWQMVELGLLLQLDWSGEENDNEVSDYVNYRLELMDDNGLQVSADEIYEKFREDAQSAFPRLQRGDHLPLLFKYLNHLLMPHGYRMLCFDTDCDQYYIGVFRDGTARRLLAAAPDDVAIVDVEDLE